MDHDLAMQFVTDRLAGELPAEKAEVLEAALAAHPDWAEEAQRLEAAWRLIPAQTEAVTTPMGRTLRDTLALEEGLDAEAFSEKYHLDDPVTGCDDPS